MTNRSGVLRTIGRAGAAGLAGGASALLLVGAMAAGVELLWPDELGAEAFSGSVRIPLVMTAAGFVVGLIHRIDRRAGEPDVFGALAGGGLDRSRVPGGLAVALTSLVGGYSLGPEVPTGMAAGGLAGAWSDRAGAPADDRFVTMRSSITGAWSGLFTAPLVGVLANAEMAVGRRVQHWVDVVGDGLAAVAGFAVFYLVTATWSDTLRILDLGSYDLELWHLLVACLVGFGGALLATVFAAAVRAGRGAAKHLDARPVTRCTFAGLLIGLVGMALPLTPFLGTDGLRTVTEDAAELGLLLVLSSLLAKLLVTAAALATGFVGGPIFPLIFVGGAAGTLVHELVSDVPLALSVPAGMVAVPSALLPLPLTLTVLVTLIAGVPATQVAPVLVAAVSAFGTGRLARGG